MATDRTGFTLIEVLVAMVLLGFALLGVQAVITDRLLSDVGRQDTRADARHLVSDRIQLIQTDPAYLELQNRYAAVENLAPQFPGYVRRTIVNRKADHTVVTVQVVTPMNRDTVASTIVIGVP